MKKRNIMKKLSGIAIVTALCICAILPTQAAVTRANSVRYLHGYKVYEGSKSAAVTEGGSAYDDRGYALNAHVYAKVTTATGETNVGTGNFTGYNSKVIARTAFLANVKTYDHDCKVGFAK
mgnify:CR=1 FL=1